jgi:hypothetical protein
MYIVSVGKIHSYLYERVIYIEVQLSFPSLVLSQEYYGSLGALCEVLEDLRWSGGLGVKYSQIHPRLSLQTSCLNFPEL